jgi:hypothetical protein
MFERNIPGELQRNAARVLSRDQFHLAAPRSEKKESVRGGWREWSGKAVIAREGETNRRRPVFLFGSSERAQYGAR